MKYICILTYILSPPGINITNRKLFKTLIDYYPLYPRDGILYLKTFPGFVFGKSICNTNGDFKLYRLPIFVKLSRYLLTKCIQNTKKTKHRA